MSIFNYRNIDSVSDNFSKQLVLLENILAERENSLSEIDVEVVKKQLKKLPIEKMAKERLELFRKYLYENLRDGILNQEKKYAFKKLADILFLENEILEKELLDVKIAILEKFVKDNFFDLELENKLSDFEYKLELKGDDSESARKKILLKYLNEIIADKRISPDEEEKFNKLCKDLHTNINFSEDLKSVIEEFKTIWRIEHNEIQTITPDINIPSGEKLYLKALCRWYENRKETVGYTGVGISKRIKIMGISMRLGGGTSERITKDCLKEIDSGNIYLTDKRIIFIGNHGTKKIELNKILNFELNNDSVKIIKETGKSPVLVLGNRVISFSGLLAFASGKSEEFIAEFLSTNLDIKNELVITENSKHIEDVKRSSLKYKSIAFLLALFFGYLGLQSFYVGKTKRGIIQILFFCLGGVIAVIWGFIDIFLILSGNFKDKNGNVLI